jgi:putative ABC transport system substrate-binding protein
MKPRALSIAVLLMLGLFVIPPFAYAQQAGKVHRIGLLAQGTPALFRDQGWLKAFQEGLRDLGWVEGQNLMIEYRFAEQTGQLPGLVAELAGLQLDLIVTINTTVTRAAMKVIKTTPIVFTVVAAPVTSGFVASLARPDGNATGASAMGPPLYGKRLELLKEIVPTLSRVAVIWEPTNPGVARGFYHGTQPGAQALGLRLQSLEVRSAADFATAFTAMIREPPDALLLHTTPLTNRNIKQIAAFALENRLPTIAGRHTFPAAGGLVSYGPNFVDNFRRVAPYVDKILKGAKPADIPVEQPTQFDLVINLKTAKALGLTIPPTILVQATEVIQ